MMIETVSAIKRDKAGDLGKNFLSLYNSKTHGGLDIQLHQLVWCKPGWDTGLHP